MNFYWTGKLHYLENAEHKNTGDLANVIFSKVCYLFFFSTPHIRFLMAIASGLPIYSRILLE